MLSVRYSIYSPVFLILFTFFSSLSYGQGAEEWKSFKHDFSIGLGTNTLLYNIGESDEFRVRKIIQRTTANFSYRYFFHRNFAARASFTHAYMRKNDKSINLESRDNIRIDYKTSVTEMAAIFEWHPFDETSKGAGSFKRSRGRGGLLSKLSIYPFAGFGAFYFRPRGEFQGQEVEFRPITAAGADSVTTDIERYDNWHLVIPLGAGVRYVKSENWRVGLEVGYRYSLKHYVNRLSTVHYTDEDAPFNGGFWNQPYLGIASVDDNDFTQADIGPNTTQEKLRSFFFISFTIAYRLNTDN